MKYCLFTYVDASTGVSVTTEPACKAPVFPAVTGLAFVLARESAYPTEVPEFFGTCPDDSALDVAGVLSELSEADWLQMQVQEMRDRNLVPKQVTMMQAELALLEAGLLDDVEALVLTLPRADQIAWNRATVVERDHALVAFIQNAHGLTDAQIDGLFIAATKLGGATV